MINIAIFLNGLFDNNKNYDSRKKIIENYDYIFLVDKGIDYFYLHYLHYKPSKKIIWIGDFDSITPLSVSYFNEIFLLNPLNISKIIYNKNKNFSDFAGVLEYINTLIDGQEILIDIYAGLGGRSDHELINLLEINCFFNKNKGLCYFNNSFICTNQEININVQNQEIFSLCIFDNNYPATIYIEGAIYEGIFNILRPSHGLSNICNSNYLKVILQKQSPIWIIFGNSQNYVKINI